MTTLELARERRSRARARIIDVCRGSLDQGPEVHRRLEALLSRDERERARRFRFDRERDRFVVGRGLLRLLLGRYVDADAAELRFEYGRHKKPALLGADRISIWRTRADGALRIQLQLGVGRGCGAPGI